MSRGMSLLVICFCDRQGGRICNQDTVAWVADMYKDKVQGTPHFKISEMKMELERERKVSVSIHKCKMGQEEDKA